MAALCVFCGQLDYSAGALAVYTIRVGAAKCAMSFGNAFGLGILCNFLVCLGVLAANSAKDTAGRLLGAYLPVCFFVLCGFEHCIANLYYIGAALMAAAVPEYAALAVEAGVDLSSLTLAGAAANLIPVTLGNLAGGPGGGAAPVVLPHPGGEENRRPLNKAESIKAVGTHGKASPTAFVYKVR